MKALQTLLHKRIAILGVGEEGYATAQFLISQGIRADLFDERAVPGKLPIISRFAKKHGLRFVTGASAFLDLGEYDLAFRSPGIRLQHPALLKAKKRGLSITSQTNFFFAHCPSPIIGVTGTKGKGTTSFLLTQILKHAVRTNAFRTGRLLRKTSEVYLVGNIGKAPPLGILLQLKPTDVVVFELSSFQLEDAVTSPHIAVVLGIEEDHIDYHGSKAKYVAAKSTITRFQKSGDMVIYNADNAISKKVADLSKGRKIGVSIRTLPNVGAGITDDHYFIKGIESKQQLEALFSRASLASGAHYAHNYLAASCAALVAGASIKSIQSTIYSFKGLPHRLELVVQRRGVRFYDDTLATNPYPTITAVKSFTEPVVLILGGRSKGASYTPLAKALRHMSHLKAIVLMGENAPAISAVLKKESVNTPTIMAGSNFEDVFPHLQKLAQPGDVVLLSPASASMDFFVDYKDKAKSFLKHAKQF